MEKLQEFLALLTGEFDNREQFDAMQAAGKEYPFAEHRNTLVNERITGLPEGFSGAFLLEERLASPGGPAAICSSSPRRRRGLGSPPMSCRKGRDSRLPPPISR